MKTFVLASDRNITACPNRKAAIASGDPIFSTVEEMAEVLRLAKVTPLEIWNTLPGITPVKKFTYRATGMGTYLETARRTGGRGRSPAGSRAHTARTAGWRCATNAARAAPGQQAGTGTPITQTAEWRDARGHRKRDRLAAAHGPRLHCRHT